MDPNAFIFPQQLPHMHLFFPCLGCPISTPCLANPRCTAGKVSFVMAAPVLQRSLQAAYQRHFLPPRCPGSTLGSQQWAARLPAAGGMVVAR